MLATVYLKGLEDVIGLSVVHPTWAYSKPGVDEHAGWQFTSPEDPPVKSLLGCGSFGHEGVVPDTITGAKTVRELYEKSGSTAAKFSVPVLYDKKTGVIVSNESSEMMRMFNTEFNKLAKNPHLDLYPEDLREKIDEVNEWVYPNINDGVYKCGFA